ncbi:MAG: hypothetical protein AABY22_30750, partial [Nanoarchaeota archaeon]
SENYSDQQEQGQYPQEQAQEGYYQPQTQEYYPQQGQDYGYNQESYEPSSGLDSETITEISEQVVLEKTKDMKSQIESMSEFKSLAKAKLDHMEERIHRIEQMMDKLQLSILEKVGSYLSNVEHVKKEMSMMQDSFSKVIENENLEKLKHIAHQKHRKEVHIVHHRAGPKKSTKKKKR